MNNATDRVDEAAMPVATLLGEAMKVDFHEQRRICTISLPADPGMPTEGVVTLSKDGELKLTCRTGMTYIGPAITTAVFDRMVDASEIRVNERFHGSTAICHSYIATLDDDFSTLGDRCLA